MGTLKFLPFVLALLSGTQALAASPVWVEQGPGPILNGTDEEGLPNNPVAGAINAIIIDPTNADVLFVGTVNGGVWNTSNASAASPTWTPLTDQQLPALSINSLAMSPVNSMTLFAGTGSTSSFAFHGSPGFGVARSTNGGTDWTVFEAAKFDGRPINSIVPTELIGGNVVLTATLYRCSPSQGCVTDTDGGGVYRSINFGASFTRVSGNIKSGLPAAGVSQLIADPSDPNRFYAGVPEAYGGGDQAGVYRSNDGGMTWTAVNGVDVRTITGLDTSLRILLSVGGFIMGPPPPEVPGGINIPIPIESVVYAAVIATDGSLSGVFRSTDFGDHWQSLGTPSPPIYGNLRPQGFIHGALLADPNNTLVVYIAGDAQKFSFDADGNPIIPNENGCKDFSANVFRGNISLLPGNIWESVVCDGANGTSPHADSRDMVFDHNFNLLQANDGGIFRLVNPNFVATRRWVPLIGDIRPTEFHSVAYDPLSKVVFGGAQDTSTPVQSSPGSFTWNNISDLVPGDGGVVAVDADQSSHPGKTLRYTSSQFFGCCSIDKKTGRPIGNFNRSTWDAANTLMGMELVGLNIVAGDGAGQTLYEHEAHCCIQFYNPYVLNTVDPSRMLIGAVNLYESTNRGDSLTNLGFIAPIGNGLFGQPLAYGGSLDGAPKAEVFYVGSFDKIYHRGDAGPISTLDAYPGQPIITIVMNPQNYRQLFVLDNQNSVWGSFDEGASWVDLTPGLPSLTSQVTTIEVFSPDQTIRNLVLIAGGFGAFEMRRPGAAGGSWTALSSEIPNALVLDLHYDYKNNVLVAGTLGRGSWTLTGFFRGGGGSGLVAGKTVSPLGGARKTYPGSICRRCRLQRLVRLPEQLRGMRGETQ
jgi:hypothetical protein